MVALIGVHGVGSFFTGRSPAEASATLARIWRKALSPLRDDIPLTMAYYAPHLQIPGHLTGDEMHHYLDGETPHRTAARAEVATVIGAASEPRIVIAHSLGSVVAYEALIGYPEMGVELFLTFESPLALVADRLDPSDGRMPPGVKRWVNLADTSDPVALRFPGVEQHDGVNLDAAEVHQAKSYLQSDAVAEILRAYVN